MTIYALPASVRGCLIPAIVKIEQDNVTEEFCFVCGRCTDHRGEHSDAQLLAILDGAAGLEHPACFAEFGPHYGHESCDAMLAQMSSYSFADEPEDVYWSGTGELMSDDSYIDYLNRY